MWLAIHRDGATRAALHRFPGGPAAVCDAACRALVEWLGADLRLTS